MHIKVGVIEERSRSKDQGKRKNNARHQYNVAQYKEKHNNKGFLDKLIT